jgi:hypothetical protein
LIDEKDGTEAKSAHRRTSIRCDASKARVHAAGVWREAWRPASFASTVTGSRAARESISGACSSKRGSAGLVPDGRPGIC